MQEWISKLTQSPYFELAGWSLVYSIWQGLILALIIFFILKSTKGYLASGWRYLIAIMGQLTIVLLTIYTFIKEIPYQNTGTPDIGQVILLFTNKTGLDLGSRINLVEDIRIYIQDYIPVFMGFWALGFIFYLVRIFGGLVYLQKVRKTTLQAGVQLAQITKDIARGLGVDKSFQIAESRYLKNPVVIGHFRPLIILPVGIASDLTLSEIKGILAHELAHIKRYDYLVNIFQSFIEALYFFNPFVWWISVMVREEREHACDDLAVAFIEDRRIYAEALIKIKERDFSGIHMLSPGIAGHKGNTLIERIKRITNKDMKSKPVDWLPALVLAAILIIPAFLLARETRKSENIEPVLLASSLPEAVVMEPEKVDDALPEFSTLMLADTIPAKKQKKKSTEEVEADQDNEAETDMDQDMDVEFDIDPEIDVEYDIDPDMDFNFSFDYDFGDLPDMRDMPSIDFYLPPMPPFYMNRADTFPNKWNEEEWRSISEQWREEMEHFRQEMSKFQEELHQNLQFNIQEWESAHRKEIEELQKHMQEEMGRIDMDELHEQQEKLMREFDHGAWQQEFQEQMENFKEQMHEFQHQIESMPDIKEHLSEMEYRVQEEMAQLEEFEQDLRKQLADDGYLKEEDRASIEFRKDELLVDGKKIKDKDLPKYQKLRQKYFPKDDGNFNYKLN